MPAWMVNPLPPPLLPEGGCVHRNWTGNERPPSVWQAAKLWGIPFATWSTGQAACRDARELLQFSILSVVWFNTA